MMKPNDIMIISAVVIVIVILTFIIVKKEPYTVASWMNTPSWFTGGKTCPSQDPSSGPNGCPSYKGTDNISVTSFPSTSPAPSTLTATADGNIGTTATLPMGSVIAWAGKGAPPNGWAICNGQILTLNNGNFVTPDLRGRFLVGASDGTSSTSLSAAYASYNVGDFGGEEVHLLTVDEMPKHTHPGGQLIASGGNGLASGSTLQLGNMAPAGNSFPHNNLPPYYALMYIIKYM